VSARRETAAGDLPDPRLDARRESRAWWKARRGRYNLALVAGGVLAFAGYCGAVSICIGRNADPDVEITIFTMAFQAVGFGIALLLANVFYGLGPLAERIVRPSRPEPFRQWLFAAGLVFSLALIAVIPVWNLYDRSTRPSLPLREARGRTWTFPVS